MPTAQHRHANISVPLPRWLAIDQHASMQHANSGFWHAGVHANSTDIPAFLASSLSASRWPVSEGGGQECWSVCVAALHPLRGSICDHFCHLKSFLLFSKIYQTFMSIIYIPVLKLLFNNLKIIVVHLLISHAYSKQATVVNLTFFCQLVSNDSSSGRCN